MNRPGRRTAAVFIAATAAAAGWFAAADPASAANKTWVNTDGNWTGTVNWSGGTIPVNLDNVFITLNSAASTTINYDNPSSIQNFPIFVLNQSGGAAVGFRQLAGTVVNAGAATIGTANQALWQMGSGTANLGAATIGASAGSAGTMTMSTGRLAITNNLRLGFSGSGQVTHSGGLATMTNLFIATGGVGTYVLNSGTLGVTEVLGVGGSGTGLFNHVSGIVNTGSMGLGSGGHATYAMSGGTATVNERLQVAGNGQATLTFSGGAFAAGTVEIGAVGSGTGRVLQTGGAFSFSSQMFIGGATSSGTYSAGGGTLSGGSIIINAGGSFFHAGSLVDVNEITLNAGGTFSQSNGGSAIDTFTHNGGTVADGYFVNGGDAFVYNSGAFIGRLNTLGSLVMNADLTIGDGWENRANNTVVVGRTITLDGFGLHHEAGTFTQSGNINSTISRVGGITAAVSPVFNQQGGIHNISGELRLGDGDSAGTYNLNNGTLNATGAVPTGASIGIDMPGQLNIGAGRAEISFLRVGHGSTGTVNHSGTGDLIAINMFVGNLSTGRYFQNNAGALVQTTGLTIAGQPGSNGQYALSAGTLQVNGSTVNNGTYTQNGGRATLQAVSGTGRMDVTGTASLTVDRIRQDFLFVADTARIFTVANGGTNGVSRLNNLFFEDFENLNFFGKWDLNNNDLVVDHDAATAADNYDRVKRYIQSGFALGSWNGNGLNSSAAIAAAGTQDRTGLGYAKSADVFGTFPATFVGQSVDNTAVLVRYTLLGDNNLNGTVEIGDFANLAANFNLPGDWIKGDYNYDFTVGIGDFALLASNYNQTLPSGAARPGAVPEPAAVAPALVVALAVCRRRRSR